VVKSPCRRQPLATPDIDGPASAAGPATRRKRFAMAWRSPRLPV